ncbi:MAG: low molecular weight phosphotyrosine protein phosphatase [Betaproteobacteria bacterium]|nr:low molecular weight phosphotyrosine protein phosphatase [Betaproteobacteria bacterium]
MGNICRSPTAEGVFRRYAERAGLASRLKIESAGTHAYHLSSPPDARAVAAGARRDFDLRRIRARQVSAEDFETFHYILAMDRHNLKGLRQLCPEGFRGHLGLFLDYAPQVEHREVPDPYYGGPQGFELVLDLVEAAAQGLLVDVRGRIDTLLQPDAARK